MFIQNSDGLLRKVHTPAQWVGDWGIAFGDGKAQASATSRAKLHDLITATGEFALKSRIAIWRSLPH